MKYFLVFTMSLIYVSQVPLSAREMLPVQGRPADPSFTPGDVFIDEACNGPAIPLTGTSFGNVTHLGKFSEPADVTFCSANGSSYVTATWTAANGDELFLRFTGQDRLRGEGEAFVINDLRQFSTRAEASVFFSKRHKSTCTGRFAFRRVS